MRTTAAATPLESAPAASSPLAAVRATAQAMLGAGQSEEALDYVLSALAAVLRTSATLERQLAQLRLARAGTRSERLDPDQLALLLKELLQTDGGGAAAPPDPEAEAREDARLTQEIEAAEQAASRSGAPLARRSRRRWHTQGVPIERHDLVVPEAERRCATCGRDQACIGEDITHQLAYVPAHFVEHEYHRPKYACGHCKDGVTSAPTPASVAGSAADPSLLAHVVVSKFADHCPLHRLQGIYARSGAVIPVSTLADWVGVVGAQVAPLVETLAARVRAATIVRTDATGLKVLDPGSAEHIVQGTIWCYVGDDRDVVFRYTPTGEGASGPWAFLAGRQGYVQADAASVFDRLYTGQVATAVELGCWAHGRRRLVALQATDCRVTYPLQLIARLYRIEHLADAKGLAAEARAALRRGRSQGVLAKLHPWLVQALASEPPSSEFAKALGYLLHHWTALTRFLDDGRVSLDNNCCERQLRAIALGRKNYLFAGSHAAAERAARLYSLLRTCAQHGVAPLPYLTDVLRQLSDPSATRSLEELLPDRWQAAQPTA